MPSNLGLRQTTRFRWTRICSTVAALAAVVAGAERASAETPTAIQDDPRPTMRQVFEEMKVLIPLSLDEATWADPEAQPKIRAALDRLENAATALEVHGRNREAGFEELALNLERDLREVGENYRIGAFEEARFFLTGSLQSCVSCHVRLPSARTFPFADQLIEQVEIQSLDPRERAWLYVTVRKFDAALSAWEGLMADPKASPAEPTTSTPGSRWSTDVMMPRIVAESSTTRTRAMSRFLSSRFP